MMRFLLLPAFAGAGLTFWDLAARCPMAWAAMIGMFGLGRLGRPWAWAAWSAFYFAPLSGLLQPAASLSGLPMWGVFPLWLVWSSLVTLPALLLGRGSKAPFLAMGCALLLVIPPFGLISTASPLLSIGALFPGSGLWGIGLTVIGAGAVAWLAEHAFGPRPAVSARDPWVKVIAGLLLTSIGLNLAVQAPRLAPQGWMALSTEYGSVSSLDLTEQVKVGDFLLPDLVKQTVAERKSKGEPAQVVFLGEGLITASSGFSQDIWMGALKEFAQSTTVIVGEYRQHAHKMPGLLASGVAVRGRAVEGVEGLSAALTFPGVMWRPWSDLSFPLGWPNSPAVINGVRTHISWCFESTLIWPHLSAAWDAPAVLVSLENRWATKGTSMEPAQTAAGLAVARWLQAAYLEAINR